MLALKEQKPVHGGGGGGLGIVSALLMLTEQLS